MVSNGASTCMKKVPKVGGLSVLCRDYEYFFTLFPWQYTEPFTGCLFNVIIIIIIIIIKICSAHISTLLGAQGTETEKTWIQTIYNDSKNHIMCRDTCTMQLQIYIIFEKLWHKMSFKQRLKSGFTMTRFEFSWKMIQSLGAATEKDLSPQVRFEVGSFRSVDLKQFRNINWSNVIKRFVNN